MNTKPTYAMLEKRLAELEDENLRLAEVQKELQRSLNFTESLLAALPTPVFYKDAEGRYLGCNAAFTDILGITAEQIRGKCVEDLWPGEHAERYHQMDLELMRNPRLQVYEFELQDKDGHIRPVLYYKNIFLDENGAVAGLVGGFSDISEIRQAQAEHQALFSMSLDMICIADITTDTFLKVNQAFTTILGYSESELLAVPFTTFIHPDDLEPTRETLAANLRKGRKVINFKNRYRCKNGQYRWLNWVSHPVPEKGVTYAVAHDSTEEIQAYEILHGQRNLLNSLFDHLPLGITVWDDDGTLAMANRAFIKLTEHTASDITTFDNWLVKSFPDPSVRRQLKDDWQSAQGSAAVVREFKMSHAGDEIRDIEFHLSSLEDGRTLITITDVTEIRQAHNEIGQRRQFLESVLYHAPDAIITLDEQHRVIDWNPGATKTFGYTAEEAKGAQLDDLVARNRHHIEASAKTEEVLSGRRLEAFETIRYRKDGTPLHVIAAGSPIIVGDELKGVVAVYTDITDRVQNEEALRVSHQRFLKVLNSIDATVYVADMQNHEILFMNNHMIETFGGDFTGRICWQVFRDESAPCSVCTNDRLVDDVGQPADVVAWQGQNPISNAWYMNFDRAIEWPDGRIVRLQIAMDITRYKKMEDALASAQKMEAIGTLASGIAHDFNNLLMGIQGRTSLMAAELEASHPCLEHTAAIDSYIKSATGLTRQLLGFARGGKYEVKPIDINELLVSSAAMFGRTHKEIRIETRTTDKPLIVEADRRQIEQVLLNIYINALQAMPDGGDLFLKTRLIDLDEESSSSCQITPGSYAEISLRDTGIGMDDDVRQKIFDPFFTTREKSRGTGLGLASAYGIIKNHSGAITVCSEKGHGSTFTLYLPHSLRNPGAETITATSPVGGRQTVLLVDDEEMILEVGQAMLELLGYRVIAASSGEAAIAQIKKKRADIDLVLLDLIMPGTDGGATFDHIRKLAPTLPVILSSGYSINGQAAEIMRRGCNGFLQKPFDIAELSRHIRLVLESH